MTPQEIEGERSWQVFANCTCDEHQRIRAIMCLVLPCERWATASLAERNAAAGKVRNLEVEFDMRLEAFERRFAEPLRLPPGVWSTVIVPIGQPVVFDGSKPIGIMVKNWGLSAESTCPTRGTRPLIT